MRIIVTSDNFPEVTSGTSIPLYYTPKNRSMDMSSCSSRTRLECSSQEIVLDEDENLLALILLRVPYKQQLLYFKSVSKKWCSLITAPHFTRLLRDSIPSLRASGLFIQRPVYRRSPDKVYFVSLDNPNTHSPFKTLAFAHDPYDPERIRILQSCNGLLLCSTNLSRPRKLGKSYVYVYNPSTNYLETLSHHPPGCGKWVSYIGLAFDPSKSIHYKLIAFEITSGAPYSGNFYMYSSETGTWKTSAESFRLPPQADFSDGVYWNGCIHWLCELISEPEPESTVSDCLCFNVDEERLETFPRPPTGARKTLRRRFYFGESEGHLHFIEACPFANSLSVYEMKNDYSGWFLNYQIDLDPISKVFGEMTKYQSIFDETNYNAVAVLSLIRREKFREDPFLVLEIPGKIIRYNLVSRSVKMIWDFSVDFNLKNIDDQSFGNFRVWQYIESV